MTYRDSLRLYCSTSEEIEVHLSVLFTITNNRYCTALVRSSDQQYMDAWAKGIALYMGEHIEREVRLWGLTLPGPRAVLIPSHYSQIEERVAAIRSPDFAIFKVITKNLRLTRPLPPEPSPAVVVVPPPPKPPERTWAEQKTDEMMDFFDGLAHITDKVDEAKRTHPAFKKDPQMATAYEAQVKAQVHQSANDYVANLRNTLTRKMPTWRNK